MPLLPPRLVISATGGDGGKTLLSLGLTACLRDRGVAVAPFKKGPDYIDAAWLSLAAGRQARNLDTFLMGDETVLRGFARHLQADDTALIEGNRGLYDGIGDAGAHSTAALARLLGAPVVLVLNATKVTRTLAAVALGCQQLEPDTNIAGVVVNNVATARHERVARDAIEGATGIPVVGAIPRRRGGGPLPDRHLGLVTPEEHEHAREAVATAQQMVRESVDVDRVLELARGAQPLQQPQPDLAPPAATTVTIGVVRDSAFSFYYPENLEALEAEGAELREVSALAREPLPDGLDGLYIGGGFPETHAAQLAENETLLTSLARAAREGLPIYAECGGLMLLARSIAWQDRVYPMSGVLAVDVVVRRKPAGHGYCVVRAARPNPFFEIGTRLRGHEFHYSTVVGPSEEATAFDVERGAGCFDNKDGLIYKNVLASYAHLHALGEPSWSREFVRKVREHRWTRAVDAG